MALKRFNSSEVVLSQKDCYAILCWFFPNTSSQLSSDSLTLEDMCFAQSLLVEVIDASEHMNFVQSLFQSTNKPSVTAQQAILSFSKKAIRGWFKYREAYENLSRNSSKLVYQSIVNKISANYATTWRVRLQTGELIY